MPPRLPYPVAYLLVGVALTAVIAVLPSFGLVGPIAVVLAAAAAAGALEGQRRVRTGTRHTAQAMLLPLVPVVATLAAYRVWFLSTRTPAPDDGMAFGILLVALGVGIAVFAAVTALVAALVQRRAGNGAT